MYRSPCLYLNHISYSPVHPIILSIYLHLSIYLSIYIPTYMYLHVPTYLSIHPSIYLQCIYPSIYLFIYFLSIHPFIHFYIYLFIVYLEKVKLLYTQDPKSPQLATVKPSVLRSTFTVGLFCKHFNMDNIMIELQVNIIRPGSEFLISSYDSPLVQRMYVLFSTVQFSLWARWHGTVNYHYQH